MNKNKNLGFTLAEVLIVIGIIGVVAALTLPNLNHATGDKETVTRLQKAYSILSEANDRAVATYGPISTWKCNGGLGNCWLKRITEFMKIAKFCDENSQDENMLKQCQFLGQTSISGDFKYQLPDGIIFSSDSSGYSKCDAEWGELNDICLDDIEIDINGTKGKNEWEYDTFRFMLSDKLGVMPWQEPTFEETIDAALHRGNASVYWIIHYGNLDYLNVNENGQCNDSNIILDGVTNTSCH